MLTDCTDICGYLGQGHSWRPSSSSSRSFGPRAELQLCGPLPECAIWSIPSDVHCYSQHHQNHSSSTARPHGIDQCWRVHTGKEHSFCRRVHTNTIVHSPWKCTLIRYEHLRWDGSMVVLILNLSTRWGWVVSFMLWLLWHLEKECLLPIAQGTMWTPEPIWMLWRRDRYLAPARNWIWFGTL